MKIVLQPLIKQLLQPAIVLDNSGIAGTAKVIFAANNSVTITGTIDGASSDEGTIQVTGATKTLQWCNWWNTSVNLN